MKNTLLSHLSTDALLNVLIEAGSDLKPGFRKTVRKELELRMGAIVKVLHNDTVRHSKKKGKR